MDIENELSEVAEFTLVASREAARSRRRKPLVELSEKLHRRLDLLVGKALAQAPPPVCAPGCNHCCHTLIPVTVPEILDIAEVLETWDTDDRAALLERIARYEQAANRYWRYDEQFHAQACPLLVDGLCSVYDHRPSFCRGKSSYRAEDCESQRRGENVPLQVVPGLFEGGSVVTRNTLVGLQQAGRYAGTYDLGASLGPLLNRPEATEELGKGDVNPLNRTMLGSDRNTDLRPLNPAARPFLMPALMPVMNPEATAEQRYQAAATASRATPYGELCNLFLPVFYDSTEEIELWDDRFRTALDRVLNSKLSPTIVFESLALGSVETFGLSYNGRDVTDIMRKLGGYLYSCARSAYPDLTAPIERRRRPGKFRLGFASARLVSSNGSRWALGWLTELNRDIETYAFNLGLSDDHVSTRWRRNVDHYFHLPIPVVDAARIIRAQDLDALLITDIGMDGETIQLSLLTCARHQMTAWGQPLTTGSPAVDTYLSSELMEPENGQDHYVERLVRLPGSGQTFPKAVRTPTESTRAELGLPPGPFLLIAQNPIKLLPHRDAIYLEISERLGLPIVICDSGDSKYGHRLQRRMAKAGIRVHAMPHLRQEAFLRMLELADVVLDSFDFTGGITTINTLTLGKPLISMPGPFMRSRLSVPFMKQAGLESLLAKDEREYIELACNPNRIASAMSQLNADNIYRDLRPVRALEEYLFAL